MLRLYQAAGAEASLPDVVGKARGELLVPIPALTEGFSVGISVF